MIWNRFSVANVIAKWHYTITENDDATCSVCDGKGDIIAVFKYYITECAVEFLEVTKTNFHIMAAFQDSSKNGAATTVSSCTTVLFRSRLS